MELTKLQRDYIIHCLSSQAKLSGNSQPFILELINLIQQDKEIQDWDKVMEQIRAYN